jgi:hypothetical protein
MNDVINSYTFYAQHPSGQFYTVTGHGRNEQEAYNNALEKTPATDTLFSEKPEKPQRTPNVTPITERSPNPVPFFYKEGQEVINRNGSVYRISAVTLQSELVLIRSDGWQLIAHNPKMYMDGGKLRMEWDYSTSGHFTGNTF